MRVYTWNGVANAREGCRLPTGGRLIIKFCFALWITLSVHHFSCVSCPQLSPPSWIHDYKPYDDGYCYASGFGVNNPGTFQINEMIAEAEADALGSLSENIVVKIEDFGIWQKMSTGDTYEIRTSHVSGRLFWSDVVIQGYERVAAWFTGSNGSVWDNRSVYVLVRIPCGKRQLEEIAHRAGFRRIEKFEDD